MLITKCDLCKKNTKDKKPEPITVWVGFRKKVELCAKCGLPVLRFLKKHKFIKKEEINVS